MRNSGDMGAKPLRQFLGSRPYIVGKRPFEHRALEIFSIVRMDKPNNSLSFLLFQLHSVNKISIIHLTSLCSIELIRIIRVNQIL